MVRGQRCEEVEAGAGVACLAARGCKQQRGVFLARLCGQDRAGLAGRGQRIGVQQRCGTHQGEIGVGGRHQGYLEALIREWPRPPGRGAAARADGALRHAALTVHFYRLAVRAVNVRPPGCKRHAILPHALQWRVPPQVSTEVPP